jgi:hypothetical protein
VRAVAAKVVTATATSFLLTFTCVSPREGVPGGTHRPRP